MLPTTIVSAILAALIRPLAKDKTFWKVWLAVYVGVHATYIGLVVLYFVDLAVEDTAAPGYVEESKSD